MPDNRKKRKPGESQHQFQQRLIQKHKNDAALFKLAAEVAKGSTNPKVTNLNRLSKDESDSRYRVESQSTRSEQPVREVNRRSRRSKLRYVRIDPFTNAVDKANPANRSAAVSDVINEMRNSNGIGTVVSSGAMFRARKQAEQEALLKQERERLGLQPTQQDILAEEQRQRQTQFEDYKQRRLFEHGLSTQDRQFQQQLAEQQQQEYVNNINSALDVIDTTSAPQGSDAWMIKNRATQARNELEQIQRYIEHGADMAKARPKIKALKDIIARSAVQLGRIADDQQGQEVQQAQQQAEENARQEQFRQSEQTLNAHRDRASDLIDRYQGRVENAQERIDKLDDEIAKLKADAYDQVTSETDTDEAKKAAADKVKHINSQIQMLEQRKAETQQSLRQYQQQRDLAEQQESAWYQVGADEVPAVQAALEFISQAGAKWREAQRLAEREGVRLSQNVWNMANSIYWSRNGIQEPQPQPQPEQGQPQQPQPQPGDPQPQAPQSAAQQDQEKRLLDSIGL